MPPSVIGAIIAITVIIFGIVTGAQLGGSMPPIQIGKLKARGKSGLTQLPLGREADL